MHSNCYTSGPVTNNTARWSWRRTGTLAVWFFLVKGLLWLAGVASLLSAGFP